LFGRDAFVAKVDVMAPAREIDAAADTDRDIVAIVVSAVGAFFVVHERVPADGSASAADVVHERVESDSSVVNAGGVARERAESESGVLEASGVAGERARAAGRVPQGVVAAISVVVHAKLECIKVCIDQIRIRYLTVLKRIWNRAWIPHDVLCEKKRRESDYH